MTTVFGIRLLVDLPTEVGSGILHNWLDLRSLVHADTAHCTRHCRPILCNLLASNTPNSKYYVHLSSSGCIQWLIMRRIHCSGVDITTAFPEVSRYLRFCPKIQRVWCSSSGAVDQIAINCRNLNSMVFTNCAISLNFNAALAYNTNLQNLRMQNVQKLTTSMFDDVHLPQLATLSVFQTICDDALIGSVVRTTAALQQIDLGFNQNFTDAGLIAVAQHCPLLRLIGLRGLQLSNGALAELTQLCPLIELLDLRDNHMLTDPGVLSVARNSRRLMSICLSHCTALTDKSLKHLTTHSATTLHTLYILDMAQVRVDVLVRLLKKCTRLHTLVLNCDLTTHYAEIIPHMCRLQTLAAYAIIYDKELCMIAQHCKQLQRLCILCTDRVGPVVATTATNERVMHYARAKSMPNDARYTEIGLHALMEGLPNLRSLAALEFRTQNDYTWCEITNVHLVRYLWQRLRPGIQLSSDDMAFRFSVLNDEGSHGLHKHPNQCGLYS